MLIGQVCPGSGELDWGQDPIGRIDEPRSTDSRGVSGLRRRRRRGATRDPAAEQASAEERALERAVAVDSAAAEAGDLARRVETGERIARGGQDAGVEVGLQTAERLAGEDGEPDGDQRAGVGVEDA